ncbi:DUF6596 domain-containing protein [Nevskia sp.]|uniref:RNA polymerase sigma factor n=1 Tax=Nevskia sp. TaxID=1929292 RepID=UPI0025F88BBC|nr:DUF6596 domain-containing protein [Nevskia sp.]
MSDTVRSAIETAAREAYGRLLAWLAFQWRDVAAAEDALADAFVAALRTWPVNGVPASPEAWLMTAAKRNLLQVARHQRLSRDPAVTVLLGDDSAPEVSLPSLPDARLKLMFVCAHPALDASVHAALMLQTVLGLDARQIARAFLVPAATLAQRLVRAKKKIRDAGLRFEEPEGPELDARLEAVLEAIYAAYGLGWDANGPDTTMPAADDLGSEAIYLARLVVGLMPGSAEARGLLALLLFCEARRAARFDPATGAFVPLHEQDLGSWDRALIAEADQHLWQASALRQPGAFQFEAAIQSAHCQRAATGQVPWAAIATLYARLLHVAPTVGARVAHAVAVGEASGADAGLELLDALRKQHPACADYQPYWAARAHLLAVAGRVADAKAAAACAIDLSPNAPLRNWLARRYGVDPGSR